MIVRNRSMSVSGLLGMFDMFTGSGGLVYILLQTVDLWSLASAEVMVLPFKSVAGPQLQRVEGGPQAVAEADRR